LFPGPDLGVLRPTKQGPIKLGASTFQNSFCGSQLFPVSHVNIAETQSVANVSAKSEMYGLRGEGLAWLTGA